jgi:hypothetical protein
MIVPLMLKVGRDLDITVAIRGCSSGDVTHATRVLGELSEAQVAPDVVFAAHGFLSTVTDTESQDIQPEMKAVRNLHIEPTGESPYQHWTIEDTPCGSIGPRIVTMPFWWLNDETEPDALSRMYLGLYNAAEASLKDDLMTDETERHSVESAEAMTSILVNRSTQNISDLKNEYHTLVENTASLERTARAHETRMDEIKLQLTALEDAAIDGSDMMSRVSQQLGEIVDHPDVATIVFNDNVLTIFTHTLRMENIDNGETAEAGEFAIKLYIDNNDGRVSVTNQTRRLGQYDHPHVSDGHFCVGDQRRLIESLMTRTELAAMTNVVIDLLKQVNPADVYTSDWEAWFQIED